MRLFEQQDREALARTLTKDRLTSGEALLVAERGTQASMQVICLSQITDELLDKLRPNVVMTPLVSDSFDALEVAEVLYCAGYTGELIVIASKLPRPKLVERELRDSAPGLRVTLSMSGDAAATH